MEDIPRVAHVLDIEPRDLLQVYLTGITYLIARLLGLPESSAQAPTAQDEITARLDALPAQIRHAVETLIYELSDLLTRLQ